MKKIYRVKVLYDVCVVADSREDIRLHMDNEMRHRIVQHEDSSSIRISKEIKYLDDLPKGYNQHCIPWPVPDYYCDYQESIRDILYGNSKQGLDKQPDAETS